jgi:hypothetical protein
MVKTANERQGIFGGDRRAAGAREADAEDFGELEEGERRLRARTEIKFTRPLRRRNDRAAPVLPDGRQK